MGCERRGICVDQVDGHTSDSSAERPTMRARSGYRGSSTASACQSCPRPWGRAPLRRWCGSDGRARSPAAISLRASRWNASSLRRANERPSRSPRLDTAHACARSRAPPFAVGLRRSPVTIWAAQVWTWPRRTSSLGNEAPRPVAGVASNAWRVWGKTGPGRGSAEQMQTVPSAR
jgi:hypothetical protein